MNECSRDKYYCHHFATCSNNRGSFTCTCDLQQGFIGDGFECNLNYAGKWYYAKNQLYNGSERQFYLIFNPQEKGSKTRTRIFLKIFNYYPVTWDIWQTWRCLSDSLAWRLGTRYLIYISAFFVLHSSSSVYFYSISFRLLLNITAT